MRIRLALVVALWCLALAPAALADQEDARLDRLFAVLQTTGDPLEAQVAEQAIWHLWMQSDSATVDLLMARGVQAIQQGAFAVALETFDSMVRMRPQFAEGWNKRATVLYLMGDYDRSLEDVERTLALEPRHFGALSGLGMIRLAQGEEPAALEAFDRALAVNPHMAGIKDEAERLRKKIAGQGI